MSSSKRCAGRLVRSGGRRSGVVNAAVSVIEQLEGRRLLDASVLSVEMQPSMPAPLPAASTVARDPQAESTASATDLPVGIADMALEAAVRAALNKPTGEITQGDMLGLTFLDAAGRGIHSLAGLEWARYLQVATFWDNGITDITPLSGLTNLWFLQLGRNQVSDVSNISGLTGLRYLGLAFDGITSIAPLSAMSHMETLDLNGNQISSLAPLAGMIGMVELKFMDNQVVDLTPLAGMTQLRTLWADRNRISDLTPIEHDPMRPLSGLTNLEYLQCSDNTISDISPLSAFTALKELWLDGNQISDLTPIGHDSMYPLSGLRSLVKLSFSRNMVSDLSPLSCMTLLEELHAGSNELVESLPFAHVLDPLSPLTQMRILDLSNNHIRRLAPLGNMDELTRMNVMHNDLDLTPGSGNLTQIQIWLGRGVTVDYLPQNVFGVYLGDGGLESEIRQALRKPTGEITTEEILSLVSLSAARKGITNLDGLQFASNLQALDLTGNFVGTPWEASAANAGAASRPLSAASANSDSLVPLTGLVHLTDLKLGANQITDISALAGLTNVTHLELWNNALADISPLQSMTGLQYVDVAFNRLDLSAGQPAAAILDALEDGGVDISRSHSQSGYDVGLREVSQWGGPIDDLYVVGSTAYALQGRDLVVLDLSDPARPVERGRLVLTERMKDIVVAGQYAYISANSPALRIVDISDPSHPTQVGMAGTSSYATQVAVVGGIAYITDGGNGLQLFDVSDPAAPVSLGAYGGIGQAVGVTVAGAYAYVSTANGLSILNVTDPSSPVFVGSCTTGRWADGLAVAGGYAYLADNDGLTVINVTTPETPIAVATLPGSWGSDVTVAGGYAYVADDSGLQVVNVSNPASPVLAASYTGDGYAWGVSIVGTRAYLANGFSGLSVVDISVPASPVHMGGYLTASSVNDVCVVGDYAYVADSSVGLQVFNIADAHAPVRLSTFPIVALMGVTVVGKYAYTTNYAYGLQILDISNPAAPVRVGGYNTPGWASCVTVTGGYAYVADGGGGLQIIDVRTPASPTLVGHISSMDETHAVAVAGNYAYLADGSAGLQIIDISNPASPTRLGGFSTPGWASDVAVAGHYAYIADGMALQIVDIATTTVPVLAGSFDANGNASGVSVADGFAYLAIDGDGIRVLNLSDPIAPVLVGSYGGDSQQVREVAVSGGYIYAAQFWTGLVVFEANYAPTDVLLSASTVAEGRPVGTVVGMLSATDLNASDTSIYTLVAGAGDADNSAFTIVGNELRTAASFDYEAKNSYSIRVRATDQSGLWFERSLTISVTDVDEIAPTVTAVYVRGSTWSSGYLSFLAGNLADSSATYGYAIPAGSGASQLQTLPWRNLNRISIAFSEDVSVAQAQFAIVGSVGSYSVSGFAYSSADHVATWSLSAAIGPDKLYLALPGSGTSPIVDLAGNVLDGEWSNPSSYSQVGSTDTFPSGNGTAGGDFAFRFDVLPGDSSGGSLGKVNVADALQTKGRSGLPVSTSTYRSDFDGNNLVNVADVLYVKSKSSIYSLPVNPPVMPVFGAAMPALTLSARMNPPVMPVFGAAFSQVTLLLGSRSPDLW